jgi:general L-amino acid transport system permease protein
MEEQVARFVARGYKEPLPAPSSERGLLARGRRHLFSGPFDTALTIGSLVVIVYFGWAILKWALLDATFFGGDRTACLPEEGVAEGACWAFVLAKLGTFIYGTYPIEERWRVNLVAISLAVLIVWLAWPRIPMKRLGAALYALVFPFVSLVLLTGGRFELSGGAVAFLLLVAAGATVLVCSLRFARMDERLGRFALTLSALSLLLLFAGSYFGGQTIRFLDFAFSPLTLVAFVGAVIAVLLAIAAAVRAGEAMSPRNLATFLGPTAGILALIFLLTYDFGLREVPTHLWGGLFVTLVVAVTGISASLPLGILLALGRRSNMPTVRMICIIFIEFWRGVPLITVLFMASFMLPLLLPDGMTFNQLLRALVGVALFSAAYMAEVIRGGLQAIPKGQYEGAQSLGLGYWQMMRMIILPQALKLVIPGIVNTFIGLFKDTSLVYIIGLADLLMQVRRGFSDPNWITPSTAASGLVFAAFVFWIFCFGMSRYSQFMERRLYTGHKR